MRGAPIKGARRRPRARSRREGTSTSGSAILTFNSSTRRRRPVHRLAGRRSTGRSRQTPQAPLETHLYDAVAQAIAQIRAAGIERRLDRRSVRRRRHRQHGDARPGRSQSAKAAHVRVFTRRAALEDVPSGAAPAARDRDRRLVLERRLADGPRADLRPARAPARPGIHRHVQLDREARTRRSSVVGRRRRSRQHEGGATSRRRSPARTPSTTARRSTESGSPSFTMIADRASSSRRSSRRRSSSRSRSATAPSASRVSDYVSMPEQKRELDALVSRVFTGTERSLERTRWWQRFKDALQFADVPIPPVYIAVGTLVATLFAAGSSGLVAGPRDLRARVPLIVRARSSGVGSHASAALFGDQLAGQPRRARLGPARRTQPRRRALRRRRRRRGAVEDRVPARHRGRAARRPARDRARPRRRADAEPRPRAGRARRVGSEPRREETPPRCSTASPRASASGRSSGAWSGR